MLSSCTVPRDRITIMVVGCFHWAMVAALDARALPQSASLVGRDWTVRHCCDHADTTVRPKPHQTGTPDAGQTPNNTPSIIWTQWVIEPRTPATSPTNPSQPLTQPLRIELSWTAHRLQLTTEPVRLVGVLATMAGGHTVNCLQSQSPSFSPPPKHPNRVPEKSIAPLFQPERQIASVAEKTG